VSELARLHVRLTDDGRGNAQLLLDDLDITNYVASDGLEVTYLDGQRGPQVTLRLIPHRTRLTLDVDLLERLLDDARREMAGA